MMKYSDIPGWFDFEKLYASVAKEATEKSVLVEVGTWRGRSIIFLAQELQRLSKHPLSLSAVDTWTGSPDEPDQLAEIAAVGGPLAFYEQFLANLSNCGVRGFIEPLRMLSIEAAEIFEPESIDFCFIDASHDYESVRSDIVAWQPKMKSGGLLAGHDADYERVVCAVQDELGDGFTIDGHCWLHYC